MIRAKWSKHLRNEKNLEQLKRGLDLNQKDGKGNLPGLNLKIIFGLSFFLAVLPSQAELRDRPQDEVVIRNNARKRLYPGGSDEEPLKVQTQLPILKIKSSVEEEEPPMSDEVD